MLLGQLLQQAKKKQKAVVPKLPAEVKYHNLHRFDDVEAAIQGAGKLAVVKANQEVIWATKEITDVKEIKWSDGLDNSVKMPKIIEIFKETLAKWQQSSKDDLDTKLRNGSNVSIVIHLACR